MFSNMYISMNYIKQIDICLPGNYIHVCNAMLTMSTVFKQLKYIFILVGYLLEMHMVSQSHKWNIFNMQN